MFFYTQDVDKDDVHQEEVGQSSQLHYTEAQDCPSPHNEPIENVLFKLVLLKNNQNKKSFIQCNGREETQKILTNGLSKNVGKHSRENFFYWYWVSRNNIPTNPMGAQDGIVENIVSIR